MRLRERQPEGQTQAPVAHQFRAILSLADRAALHGCLAFLTTERLAGVERHLVASSWVMVMRVQLVRDARRILDL
jgi:hypothetical protein